MKRILILMLFLIIFTAASHAADYVWQEVNEADWNSPTWTVGALTNQYPNDLIADNNTNDHSGDNFLIKDNGDLDYVTSQVRLRIEGGTLTVDNSRLEIIPTTTENMAGFVLGFNVDGEDGAEDANLILDNGATLVVSSLNAATRTIYLQNGSILVDGGSTIDISDNSSSQDDCIEIENGARFKVTGNSTILSNSGADSYIRLDGSIASDSNFTFESGTITLDSNNSIRSSISFSNVLFNWTGSAGAAILTASTNDQPGKELPQKLEMMGIDGIKLDFSAIPDYNEKAGPYGNIADINAALEDQPIHGRYFFMTADSNQGQMTLGLADTNSPNVDEDPESVLKFPGESADFNCIFWSAATPITTEVVWEFNGSAHPTDDTITPLDNNLYKSTLSLTNVDISDEGDYVCTISVTGGDVNSASASLTIKRQMAHWKFDGDPCDSNGNYDLDSSNGSPTYVAGNVGPNAINFVGDNNDWVYTDLDPNENWDAGWTVSLWAKNPDPNQGEFTGIFATGPDGFNIALNSDVNAGYRYKSDSTNIFLGDYSSDWVLLTVTCDATNTTTYFNGIEVNSKTEAKTKLDAFIVGVQKSQSPGLSFTGSVDDVQVWNYPLDKLAVYDIYNAVTGENDCVGDYASKYDLAGPGGIDVPDCRVDLYDFDVWIDYWLDCGLFPQSHCQ